MKTLFVCSAFLLLSITTKADPTRPAAGWQPVPAAHNAQAVAETLKLQLIKEGTQGKTAVINGQQVSTGQHFGRYRVKQISSGQVILEANGEQQVLSLLNTAIKQYE